MASSNFIVCICVVLVGLCLGQDSIADLRNDVQQLTSEVAGMKQVLNELVLELGPVTATQEEKKALKKAKKACKKLANKGLEDCSTNPCQNGGACTCGVDNYICTCVDGYDGDNCENVLVTYKNCAEMQSAGYIVDGVYDISPRTGKIVSVYCDFNTDGGGWTVLINRFPDGSADFSGGWADYLEPFGNPAGEYFFGLDNMRALVEQGPQELRVDLKSKTTGETGYAKYSSFSVGDAADNYRLSVGGYSGDAGDQLSFHNGMQFSTWDADNDDRDDRENCAVVYSSGWWYANIDCYAVNLNGVIETNRMAWSWFKGGSGYPSCWMAEAQMKVRPDYFA